jgi:hypothetical protein
MAALTLTF